MKTFMLGSVAAAALALSIGTASAQSQRDRDSAVTLTPEQRAIVRDVIRDELQDRVGNRIADRLSQLSPEQREAIRSAIKQKLAAEVREGLFPTGSQTGLAPAPVSLVKGCRGRSASVSRIVLPSSRQSNAQPSAPS